MLELFEDITYELNEEELKMIPVFIKGFEKKIGSAMAITSNEIINKLQPKFPNCTLTGARIRKIINHIRTNNLIPGLIASSKGYYISNNIDELQKYINSLYGRENAIKKVRIETTKFLNHLISVNKM